MAIYCGSDNPIAFEALVRRVGRKEAVYLWQLNKGMFNDQGFPTKGAPNTSSVEKTPTGSIYSRLGNKTESGKVLIVPYSELKNYKTAITPEGIISIRMFNTNEHFGNPFSHEPEGKAKGLIKTETIKEAVEKYIDWVINSKDQRAEWIREKLKSGELKNKIILYYRELGEPSHATALDYLINKYDWNKSNQENQVKGINIFTASGDILGRALTNPNWGYRKDGKDYFDVETNYKNTKSTNSNPQEALREDMNIMYQLIVKKFKQNPELIDMINERGGLEFIQKSSHWTKTDKEGNVITDEKAYPRDRWVGEGMNSNFIKVLAKAYETAAADLGKLPNSSREFTPEEITSLKPNEVFVFGSNTEGRHGKGAAKTALDKFGAIQGKAEGLQGQSYAVITKDLSKGERSIPLERIGKGLQDLMLFAQENTDKRFYVTKLGSSLAGYSVEEIKSLFEALKKLIPENVILPKEYEVRGPRNPKKRLIGYISHSGGASGSDITWENIGEEYGVDTKSYTFPGHSSKSKEKYKVDTTQKMYDEVLKEADREYAKASRELKRNETNKTWIRGLMLRNWFQVKYSDKVFAIGRISNNKVEGGTGYAVQMAINNDKPVVVFDQNDNVWKEWDGTKFVPVETPVLTKNFAGIGTREITPEGVQAIRDVYEKTSGNSVTENTNERPNVEKIDFSTSKNKFGLYKQDLFSQFLNSTVDIAADPYFTSFNFTPENIGASSYLIHYGWNPNTITYLMNQPIIREYNKEVSKLKDPKKKINIKLSFLTSYDSNLKSREEFSALETVSILEMYGVDVTEYRIGKMTSSKKNKMLEQLSEILDTDSESFVNKNLINEIIAARKGFNTNEKQRAIFAFYLKTQKQAEYLRELQTTAQMDTTKLSTPIEALNARLRRRAVLDSGLFDEEAVQKIWKDSMVSAFDYGKDVEDVFKALMPTTMDDDVVNLGLNLFSRLYGKDNKKRFHKIFFNDWIEFLIKNFGKIEGENFEERSERFIKSFQGSAEQTLTDILKGIKVEYPKLFEKILLPKLLYPNIMNEMTQDHKGRKFQYKNIELGGDLDAVTEFKNVMSDEFRMLVNLTVEQAQEILENPQITEEQVEKIREFFKNLEYAAFQQSGYNMSPISFFDVVPYEDILPIFKDALDTYKELTKDSTTKAEIIREFENSFKRENKKFKLFFQDNVNHNSWRGKNYRNESMDYEWARYSIPRDQWESMTEEEKQALREQDENC